MDRMNVYSFSDQMYADIVKTYLDTLSIKETADKLHTSEVKGHLYNTSATVKIKRVTQKEFPAKMVVATQTRRRETP